MLDEKFLEIDSLEIHLHGVDLQPSAESFCRFAGFQGRKP
jgi:hypothetical protein